MSEPISAEAYYVQRSIEEAEKAIRADEPCRAAVHRALSVLYAERAEKLMEAELAEGRSALLGTSIAATETTLVEQMIIIPPH